MKPDIAYGLSERIDTPEAERQREVYEKVPVEVRDRMNDKLEAEAHGDMTRGVRLAEQEKLAEVRDLIRESGVEWTPEDIAAAEAQAMHEAKPEPAHFEQATAERTHLDELSERETQATESSPLSAGTIERLQTNRAELIKTLTSEYQTNGRSPEDARVKAEDRFVRMLETGKYSGRDTSKGVDRSFRQYFRQAGGRINETWNRYPGFFRKLMMIPLRVGAEVAGAGLFAGGKAAGRLIERRRFKGFLGRANQHN